MAFAALAALMLLVSIPGDINATESKNRKFLSLEQGQRYWWYEGAFRTVAHLVSMHDKKKGDCAAAWYLRDREAKQKIIEDALKENPDRSETSIILGLLTQACGKLYGPVN